MMNVMNWQLVGGAATDAHLRVLPLGAVAGNDLQLPGRRNANAPGYTAPAEYSSSSEPCPRWKIVSVLFLPTEVDGFHPL